MCSPRSGCLPCYGCLIGYGVEDDFTAVFYFIIGDVEWWGDSEEFVSVELPEDDKPLLHTAFGYGEGIFSATEIYSEH